MKEICTKLFPNEHVGQKVSEYSDRHSVPLCPALIEYHEWVQKTQPCAFFTISLLESRMLLWLARLVGAKRVLEIGAFVGFSVAAWAEAVGGDGRVTGLEQSPEYARFAREQLARYGWKNAEILVGDALETMSRLELQDPYDIIFIDAKKSEYPGYLNSILEKSQPGQKNRMLRPGGLIVGDNVLREGLVADASEKNPATETVPKETVNWDSASIARLDEFNKAMHENPRIEAVLLPLFDGLAIGRLLD
ncbi:hypothetical protein E4U13_002515 [Claviceps humidiphila]|uniref:O-methyltransferase n=1 Tax=Claviceps humidiphila TaxID=1294629 RepID=A0A9P7Q7R9_9HYPO|nr:hypothetical protein E4U13_002515 [Claviceps humidiphila]